MSNDTRELIAEGEALRKKGEGQGKEQSTRELVSSAEKMIGRAQPKPWAKLALLTLAVLLVLLGAAWALQQQ